MSPEERYKTSLTGMQPYSRISHFPPSTTCWSAGKVSEKGVLQTPCFLHWLSYCLLQHLAQESILRAHYCNAQIWNHEHEPHRTMELHHTLCLWGNLWHDLCISAQCKHLLGQHNLLLAIISLRWSPAGVGPGGAVQPPSLELLQTQQTCLK